MPFMTFHHGEINFSEWTFDNSDKLNSIISEAAQEAVKETFAEDPPYLSLPFCWAIGENPNDGHDGPAVSDPLTIDLSLPLGTEENQPTYRISFSDLAVDLIEGWRCGGEESGYTIEDVNKQQLHQFVNSLRLLADSLESRINNGVPLEQQE